MGEQKGEHWKLWKDSEGGDHSNLLRKWKHVGGGVKKTNKVSIISIICLLSLGRTTIRHSVITARALDQRLWMKWSQAWMKTSACARNQPFGLSAQKHTNDVWTLFGSKGIMAIRTQWQYYAFGTLVTNQNHQLTHLKLKYRVDGLQKNGFSSQEYLLAVKIVKTTHSGDSARRVFFKLKIVQLIFVCCT